MEKEKELNPFVYIKGVKNRGQEVIAELEKRGGYNWYNSREGDNENYIYYIDSTSIITHSRLGENKWVEKHYTEFTLPYQPKDKDLVWCWNDDIKYARYLKFYDSTFKCTYAGQTGYKKGPYFQHYAPYEGEWPQWAKEAVKELED